MLMAITTHKPAVIVVRWLWKWHSPDPIYEQPVTPVRTVMINTTILCGWQSCRLQMNRVIFGTTSLKREESSKRCGVNFAIGGIDLLSCVPWKSLLLISIHVHILTYTDLSLPATSLHLPPTFYLQMISPSSVLSFSFSFLGYDSIYIPSLAVTIFDLSFIHFILFFMGDYTYLVPFTMYAHSCIAFAKSDLRAGFVYEENRGIWMSTYSIEDSPDSAIWTQGLLCKLWATNQNPIWCNGNIAVSHTAARGSIPRVGDLFLHFFGVLLLLNWRINFGILTFFDFTVSLFLVNLLVTQCRGFARDSVLAAWELPCRNRLCSLKLATYVPW